ncbi:hypothetical protein AB852_06265 [Streptomyces uncialis]|uniref:Uncharacterized protein n=1 Tax=Streptomyces uncialis TaxID=1048205 RepID=A0A1Q4VEI0_9ACTN|nr:hypothetical protein AB852_06265 [Streptomyces uncialis]
MWEFGRHEPTRQRWTLARHSISKPERSPTIDAEPIFFRIGLGDAVSTASWIEPSTAYCSSTAARRRGTERTLGPGHSVRRVFNDSALLSGNSWNPVRHGR